jgi:hypothetical protein
LCCKQFGFEYIGYKERVHYLYGFCLRSKYTINDASMAGRHFQIASTGTFVIIYMSLYALRNNKPFIIEDIVDEDIEKIWTIKGGIYREVLFKIFRFYQSFDFYAFDFPEMEKGDFSEQLMIKIKEEVGEQIIEDVEYGKDYIKWKKGEKERRELFRIEELIKQK